MARCFRVHFGDRATLKKLCLAAAATYIVAIALAATGNIKAGPFTSPVRASNATPLLVLTDGTNTTDPFGPYLAEILRAEGMPSFATADIATLNDTVLTGVGILLLGPTSALSTSQIALLTNYVQGGGRLIGMSPHASLATLFGVSPVGTRLTGAYMRILPAGLGVGFSASSLQIHAYADAYTLNGASSIATLYSDATTSTAFPAVTLMTYGQGQAMLWAYDLAKSIVYTRQGDPGRVGEHDGVPGYRTTDLFAGYVDLNNMPIPQADEQQRLLTKAIASMSVTPLPHLWYFPQNAGAMLILTSDAHGNPTAYFNTELTSVQRFGGHVSLYLSQAGIPTPVDVGAWKQAGHGVGIHPYLQTFPQASACIDAGLQQGIADGQSWFQGQFGVAASATTRIHEFPWQCWADAATIEANAGIGMDTTYYTWGSWLQRANGTWTHGYMNGSGLPMQMVDATGHLIPLYQQVTALADEQLIAGILTSQEKLSGASATAISQQLIDASLAGGNYAAIMTEFAVDYYAYPDATAWAEGTMAYAQSKGVPIWSADDWLRFTRARATTAFGTPTWDGQNLSFAMTVPGGPDAMPLMVPLTTAGARLTGLAVDGATLAYQTRAVKGSNSAVAIVNAGSHAIVATYAPANPSVTSIAPIKGSTNGGSSVTLSGTNFDPSATLAFGGANATNVSVNIDGTSLTAVTPSHVEGAVNVVVTNPGNRTFTVPNGFTYVSPPTIAGINPPAGLPAGGTTVMITGTGFQPGAAVTVGGKSVVNAIINPAGTAITFTTPSHAPATVDVIVRNPDGQTGSLPASFAYGTPTTLPVPQPSQPAGSGTPPPLPRPRPTGGAIGGPAPNPIPVRR